MLCSKNDEKKRKLADLISGFVKENEMTEADVIHFFKAATRNLSLDWLKLFTSDWMLSTIFSFVTFIEIVKLDMAICNRLYRKTWLISLKNNCPSKFCAISDKAIDWCLAKSLKFETVYIDYNSKATNDGIFTLAKICNSNLKTLVIIGYDMTDEGFQCFSGCCSYVETIKIESIIWGDINFRSIGFGCRNLKVIDISEDDPGTVTNIGLKELLKHCKLLVSFRFSFGCYAADNCMTDEILSYLGIYCPLLESISLVNISITDTFIETFTKGCNNLKSVSFYECGGCFSDAFLTNFSSYCPLLEKLEYVFNTESNRNVVDFDDDLLKTFAEGCPLLHTFIVPNHTIKVHGMESLVSNCPLLTLFDINSSSITDDALIELGKLKNLKKLHIGYCNKITDVGIAGFVEANQTLEGLRIGDSTKLTDASLASIADGCPNLKLISLFIENDMTTMGIIFLFNKCKNLSTIHDISDKNGYIPKYIRKEMEKRRQCPGFKKVPFYDYFRV